MDIKLCLQVPLNGQVYFSEQAILKLFQQENTDLSHGGTFTGKPHTLIHENEQAILKIRENFRLPEKSACAWIQQAAKREAERGVYHPNKSWVVIDDGSEECWIGNICPRLMPLHKLFQSESSPQPVMISHWLEHLLKLFEMYFQVAARDNERLDEGLSNFGLDSQGTLFYLDDDLYPWDKFVSCAHMLGVYLRMLRWLETEQAAQLGQTINQHIMKYFDEPHYLLVLQEQLKNLFIAPQRQPVLDALVQSFSVKQTKTKPTQVNKPGRYLALLADIHANLPALEMVLAFCKEHQVHQGLVLGDVVGYGPQPSACIQRIQDAGFDVIKGNHDHALATGNFTKGFSPAARWALEWNLERVSQADRDWLGDLPPVLQGDDWLALHGAPVDPTFFNAYVYLMTYQANLDVLQERNIRLCFHGHTHLPGAYGRVQPGLDKEFNTEKTLSLSKLKQVLICPGSVGQPRNQQSGAQFAIYDREEGTISFHCLTYDSEALLATMETEGFPSRLMNHLRQGDA